MKEWIVQDTLNNKYVQELVRCKDCKYAFFNHKLVLEGHVLCTKPNTERGLAVKQDKWFCADGVREDENKQE